MIIQTFISKLPYYLALGLAVVSLAVKAVLNSSFTTSSQSARIRTRRPATASTPHTR
jgi:hypothetical protein